MPIDMKVMTASIKHDEGNGMVLDMNDDDG